MTPPFFTIGHSTRSLAELIELLRNAGVKVLVDVRMVPRSRMNPQFNGETLPKELAWKIHEELAGADQAVEIV
jgi:uncharacterized protein (DUF488 family)